jgi:hypothetical protein
MEKLPGKPLRHLLRLQAVLVCLPSVIFREPGETAAAAAPSWPTSSAHASACAGVVADETSSDRVQAQRKQAWCRSLLGELLHGHSLSLSLFRPLCLSPVSVAADRRSRTRVG